VLANLIEKEVGSIIGILVNVIAVIMNFIYNLISTLTEKHALGIAIILMTLVIRLVMLPQGISQQKSSIKMRKVQPEIDKIKKKYGNSKDPEIQRKINMETQAVYQKHKINLFAGCLPLLITLPIFYALIDLMRRLYVYVDKIRDLYTQIGETILRIPGIAEVNSVLWNIAVPMVPSNYSRIVYTNKAEDLVWFIDKFTPENWTTIRELVSVDPAVARGLEELLVQRDNVQHFLGLNLVNTAGLGWPGIIIPILSAGTSFLLSFLSSKVMQNPSQEQAGKMNQRIMMIVMPAMMFFFTISVSGGVGVYWIASNVIAVVQQIALAKIYLNRGQDNNGDINGKAKEIV
jgi:YidC/Oxa1 family membrane protein insertase